MTTSRLITAEIRSERGGVAPPFRPLWSRDSQLWDESAPVAEHEAVTLQMFPCFAIALIRVSRISRGTQICLLALPRSRI